MERDCMIAHGAASFLKERLFEVSDAYRIHLCGRCGIMGPITYGEVRSTEKWLTGKHRDPKKGNFICQACGNKTEMERVNIPYAAKLLFQELASMNIVSRMFTTRSGVTVRDC